MSARPENQNPSLRGAEGELVSMRIAVEPKLLEKLLDVLARLSFPINPQLYHNAATVSAGLDGGRRTEPATIVEFPAWAGQVAEVGGALTSAGFDAACSSIQSMLEDILSSPGGAPAPPGARHKAIAYPLRAIA